MIDTLEEHRESAEILNLNTIINDNLLAPQEPRTTRQELSAYTLITMHRPSNVDQKEILAPIINFLLEEVCSKTPIIWPIHPRTQKQLQTFGLWNKVIRHPKLILLHPVGYHEMLRLNIGAHLMLTDSGGLQEECCVLGTPCLTLRWNTERPVTLRENGRASVLVGNNVDLIRTEYLNTIRSQQTPLRPMLWDGNTAERIVKIMTAKTKQLIDHIK